MSKPTSQTISELIEFVTEQSEVKDELEKRDKHPRAACTEIHCRFQGLHKSDPTRSAYEVAFIYQVRDGDLGDSDDIYVRVERREGDSTSYRILNVKVY